MRRFFSNYFPFLKAILFWLFIKLVMRRILGLFFQSWNLVSNKQIMTVFIVYCWSVFSWLYSAFFNIETVNWNGGESNFVTKLKLKSTCLYTGLINKTGEEGEGQKGEPKFVMVNQVETFLVTVKNGSAYVHFAKRWQVAFFSRKLPVWL